MYPFTYVLTLSITADELADELMDADMLSESGVMLENFIFDVHWRDVAIQSCSYRVLDIFGKRSRSYDEV